MANYPDIKAYVQTEQVQTRKPISEFLMQSIAGSLNLLLNTTLPFYKFTMNGHYFSAAGKNGVDGIYVLEFDGEIVNAYIYQGESGTSGATELDIKISTDNGSTWNSVFSTTPKIASTASASAYCGIGDTVTGCTAAVLATDPAPYQFVKGNAIRMDCITTQTGIPNNAGVQLVFQPRTP